MATVDEEVLKEACMHARAESQVGICRCESDGIAMDGYGIENENSQFKWKFAKAIGHGGGREDAKIPGAVVIYSEYCG